MQYKPFCCSTLLRIRKTTRIVVSAALALVFMLPAAGVAVDLQWRTDATGVEAGGDVIESKGWRLQDGSIYTATDRAVARSDLSTGARLWVREVASHPSITPLSSGGIAVISTDWPRSAVILQRFASDGAKLWEFSFGNELAATPSMVVANVATEAIALHLGDSAGTLRLVDVDGNPRWQRATGFGASDCALGRTGAVLCASRTRLSLFSRLDGSTLVDSSSEGYLSAFPRVVSANDDGSFSVVSTAFGASVRRLGANGELQVELPPPSTGTQWALRQNGGAIAYETTAVEGGYRVAVTALSASGSVEWRSSLGPVGRVVEARAFGNDLYLQTYWSTLVRFRLGVAYSTLFTAPFSLVGSEFVDDDLIYASGGPLLRRRLIDNSLVWTMQAGLSLTDNAYPNGCSPSEFLDGLSLYAPYSLRTNQPLRLDVFSTLAGSVAERLVPEVVDLDESSPGGASIAARHCRLTVDESGAAERVVVRRAAGGAMSWLLRRTDMSGATLSESAPISLVTSDGFVRIRDVERAPDGSRFVQVNRTLSKFDPAGTLLWTVELPASVFAEVPDRLLVDDSGGVFASRSDFNLRYLRKYAGDGTLLWEQVPASAIRTWASDGAGGIFVAYTPNGDTVESIAATGQSRWASTLVLPNGSGAFPEFRFLARDGNGGLLVSGCYKEGTVSVAFALGFNAQGARTFLTMFPKADARLDSCPSSIGVLANGSVLISVLQTYWATSSGNDELPWNTATYQVSASGAVEAAWHDIGSTARRTRMGWTFVRALGDGTVLQGGRFSSPSSYFMSASARRWRLSGQAVSLTVDLAAATYQFGQRLPLLFTLRGPSNAPVNADTPREVWVVPAYVESDDSHVFPPPTLACVIPTGQSSCTNTALRVRKVATNLSVLAFVDGAAPVSSPMFEGTRANVVLSARTLTPSPYRAFDVVTVEYTLVPSHLGQGEVVQFPPWTSYWSLPSVNITRSSTSGVFGCPRYGAAVQFPMTFRCDILLGTSAVVQSAVSPQSVFNDQSNQLDIMVGPVELGPVTIKLVRLWPDHNVPIGTPIAPVVSVMVGTTPYPTQLPSGSITIAFGAQSCLATPVTMSTPFGPYFFGEYWCAITPTQAATSPLTARFAGGSGLPVVPLTTLATISVVSTTGFFVDHPIAAPYTKGGRVCSTTPGLSCEANPQGTSSLCLAANGWRGALFLQPNSDIEFTLASPPPIVGPLAGFSAQRVTMPSAAVRSTFVDMCLADLDRDGYVTAEHDGLAFLKLMFGISAQAALSDAAHVCSSRTSVADMNVVGQQVQRSMFDIDGDYRVAALTDGMLLMRYLLGMRGTALTAGLGLSLSGTRTTPDSIASYLQGRCALAP